MIESDDVEEIRSLLDEMEGLRGEIKEKLERLLKVCGKFHEVSSDADSLNHISKRDLHVTEDMNRTIQDFRLPEKIRRSLPDLENELYRETEDRKEIDQLLEEIDNI